MLVSSPLTGGDSALLTVRFCIEFEDIKPLRHNSIMQ